MRPTASWRRRAAVAHSLPAARTGRAAASLPHSSRVVGRRSSHLLDREELVIFPGEAQPHFYAVSFFFGRGQPWSYGGPLMPASSDENGNKQRDSNLSIPRERSKTMMAKSKHWPLTFEILAMC